MVVGIEKTKGELQVDIALKEQAAKGAPKAAEMTKPEYEQNVQTLANLEAIRVNQFEPFNLFLHRDGNITANNTTSQRLLFEVFEEGYIYIITSICAYNIDKDACQIRIGIIDGVTDCVYQGATVAAKGDTVEYVGQLMLKETDKVYADFLAVDATDDLYVSMNGYKIRR